MFDRQHGWQHSPRDGAADTREAEPELARVAAALRVWHAAAATAATATTATATATATAAATAVAKIEETATVAA